MDYKILIEGIMIGYAVGVFTGLVLNQNGLTTEKVASLILGLFWLLFHVYGFIADKTVPFMFDIVGVGSTASFAGLNISNILKLMKGNG